MKGSAFPLSIRVPFVRSLRLTAVTLKSRMQNVRTTVTSELRDTVGRTSKFRAECSGGFFGGVWDRGDIAPNSWLGFWERLLVAQSYEWINTRRPVRRHPSRKERHSSQENDRGSKSYGVRWREAVKPTADKPGGSQR